MNRFDDSITLTQFELDNIKEGMDFRQKFLISAFVNYHQTMATLPSRMSDIDPNRYAREAVTINVRNMFGPMRVEDMEYRHPNIFRSILQFESAYENFREGIVGISFLIKEVNTLIDIRLGALITAEDSDPLQNILWKEYLDIQENERARIILNHALGNHDYYSTYPLHRFKDVLTKMDDEVSNRIENLIRKGEGILPYFRNYEAIHASLSNDLVYRFGTSDGISKI